ncbi:acyl-CoA dehydrogenase family protein [Aminobacter sp. J44]|uniref:acyl-CoA dehydrogenase family protein n=1 Tax=Aminobacter sp. J44 TaxID=935262 RepID=UPI0011990303|nr:acyl-CoA dehydrogenase family protein [Aminobacter sp. J44]TWG53878.1 hypothetical protein L610_004000000050 [Aminobacter sp. J44]
MIPFEAPVDDILFSLAHVARAQEAGWDRETGEAIITHFGEFAAEVLAPINAPGDAEGCRLENGRVLMPDGFREAYQKLAGDGWLGLTAPEEFGGQGVDALTAAAITEIFAGANHSLQMVSGLVPGAVSTLMHQGSREQQEAWIPRLISGEFLATMCLTEPEAGSDLARIRCAATQDDNGWRIDGEKTFISGGGQDMSENILHLVLARTAPMETGLRGLSLFLVPAQVEGRPNGVAVTRIEEKLGLHASPTCQMRFDNARAELVGVEGQGLAAMFILMNHARIDVSMQGVAHATRAHAIASAYAATRVQGRKADRSPAVLSDHADVRRKLDEQRILALGARGMSHVALVESLRGAPVELIDFLTPICKIFGTESGIRASDLGIQILGGYGYLTEYGLSQCWRDARITAIYEGANGIHALQLATRALTQKGGAGADAFAALVERLAEGADWLPGAIGEWQARRAVVVASDNPAELAHDFSRLTIGLYLRAVWHRIAAAADAHPDADELRRLAAKVASVRL